MCKEQPWNLRMRTLTAPKKERLALVRSESQRLSSVRMMPRYLNERTQVSLVGPKVMVVLGGELQVVPV